MAKNKKAFIEAVKKGLSEIDPGNPSIDIICQQLEKMSAGQLETYIKALENGLSDVPNLDAPRELIPLVVPNMKPTKISTERNLKLIDKWGLKVFERVWMVDGVSGTRYLTNVPYAVMEMPVMRQAQTLEKGLGYSDNDTQLDSRTNAISSKAKGASLSGPELQSLLSQGRIQTAIELMKFRGGDDTAYRHMTKSLSETGKYAMDQYPLDTRAKSTDTVAIYLKSQHIQTNL